jgi:Flp pilus assembly protein TadD
MPETTAPPRGFARPSWPLPLALAVVAVLPFLPALRGGFVWDDVANFVGNPDYRGLGWPQLTWLATTAYKGHYIPLTWVTFGLDYLLWGMAPMGYHLTNLVLHGGNAALFYVLARRLLARGSTLTGRPLTVGAAAAAGFFAVHPLRTESVAWVTERRDVLSGLFFLLAVLAYVAAAEAAAPRRRRLLVASVAAYGAALASKSIVMTLPAILVVLDVYPLRRLPGRVRDWLAPAARPVWLEKLPYVLLTVTGAATAYWAQVIETDLGTYPWAARVAVAAYGVWFYLARTAWPAGLSPLYEVPIPLDPFEPRFVASAVLVVVLTGVLVLLRRRWPAGLAVWACYGILLGPVTGLVVRAGFQLAADRYSYLACLGFALLLGAGMGLAARRPAGRPAVAAAAVLLALALGVLTWRQAGVWHDNFTLWRHAVSVTPECAICRNNLGALYVRLGDPAAALPHFAAALALRPDRVEVHGNLGLALARLGRWPEAIVEYERVLARRPDAVDVRQHLASALWETGRPDEAIAQLRQALAVAPDDSALRANLGFALIRAGRPLEAAEHLGHAVALRPLAPVPRLGLVQAYLAAGRADLARGHYERLRALDARLARQVAAAFGE